jgi:preprotein translocase subunit SecG
MEQVLLVLYVLLSAAMIGLILLQQGRGADMGASFGAGASQTVFGSSGAGNVLTRGTAILATLFFLSSVGLAVMAKHKAEAARDAAIQLPAVIETRDNAPPAADVPAEPSTPAGSDIPAAAETPSAPPAAVQPDSPGSGDIPSGN